MARSTARFRPPISLTTSPAFYSSDYGDTQQTANDDATSSYKDAIAGITTVNDLLNSTAYNYILSAYGLDPDNTSKYLLTQILQSDPSDPRRFANQSHNAPI